MRHRTCFEAGTSAKYTQVYWKKLRYRLYIDLRLNIFFLKVAFGEMMC